ncbi:MAG: DRTGG domain-containing protein [Candidatus Thermoplasmatota archaeon]
MKIEEVARLLNATVHYIPEGYDVDITYAGASDLMSDVLAYVAHDILQITGLLSPQVIRTASLMGISAVLFTRGKIPTQEIIDAAKDAKVAVLSTSLKTFSTCGRLYCAGIHSIDGDTYEGKGLDCQ